MTDTVPLSGDLHLRPTLTAQCGNSSGVSNLELEMFESEIAIWVYEQESKDAEEP
jgi:hypothetical protein